jgi:methyl-accepting chemotaxis protein
MDQMTQQNAAMVEQSTAATHSLSQEIAQLSGLIGQFRLGRANDNDAMRRELQKVAPHAFLPTPEIASRPSRGSAVPISRSDVARA